MKLKLFVLAKRVPLSLSPSSSSVAFGASISVVAVLVVDELSSSHSFTNHTLFSPSFSDGSSSLLTGKSFL